MGWFILVHVFTTLMSLVSMGRLSEKEKDLEILVLRQQLAILQRKCHKPVKPNRAEKLTLAILAAKLKQATQRPTDQLRDVIRIFPPETVMRWHPELVRRKWTYQGKHKGDRASARSRSWPVISSPSKPSGCRPCRCSSSSNWVHAGCIWLA